MGSLLFSDGVPRTGELDRIASLPRRAWESDPTMREAQRALEAELRLPGGDQPCGPDCTCPRSLWPNQTAALIEAATLQGLFAAPHGVGKGKALISLLCPTLMRAERPVLFVPAQLRDQTLRRVIPAYRRHWRMHPNLRVVGYSELSLAKNRTMLDDLAPDLVILDEAHNAKNAQAARVKRLKAYLHANPLTRVVVLSGSVTRRSLLDYWQLLLWALKPDLAPLPGTWTEVREWADALDEGLLPHERKAPGALMLLCNDGEEPRDGYRRRFVESPGVVATSTTDLGVSLRLERRKIVMPSRLAQELAKMRESWVTPYGDEITEAVDLWRHARELALGFFYRWEPMPPIEWAFARREWRKLVRETIRRNRRGLDSELLVSRDFAARADRGERSEEIATYLAWRDVRDSFEINTVAEWIDDFAVNDAAAWMRESDSEGEPGIVWTEHVAFAERLAKVSGFPYFGAGMKASATIGDASGPIIASLVAHGEGKNLQRWNRNLFVAPPPSGKIWEQALGRTHREGQRADEVIGFVYLHAQELEASFAQALKDARYIEQTTGARQKLLYADRNFEI